jgi:hypothetical protein
VADAVTLTRHGRWIDQHILVAMWLAGSAKPSCGSHGESWAWPFMSDGEVKLHLD